MLCHHPGQRTLRGAVLDRSRRFEGAEPVRVVAGIFLWLSESEALHTAVPVPEKQPEILFVS